MGLGEGTRVLGEETGLASSGVHIYSSDWLDELLRPLTAPPREGGAGWAAAEGWRLTLLNAAVVGLGPGAPRS